MNIKTIHALTLIAWFLCAGLLSARADGLTSTTLTMDELPFQPVNGLTFKGVTFHFTIGGVASTDANYHAGNGGIEHYVQDPSLEGNSAGVLTLDFATPTAGLQFGVARSFASSMSPGAQVSLFDPALTPLGTFNVNTTVFVNFTEGLFTSNLTIGRAVLTFPNPTAARFAIDNVIVTPVPEPATASVVLLGLVCLGAGRFAKLLLRN